ncbi:CDP-diacylglycerol--serine O-phosphatidyltransferase [Proteiniclasticum sp. BAD-10]|uniref:CDP-diacylglycerol--serine O-phosphatidyltransferase n=1 Tax=Proteiniclasticum sediminis TaxID=2804028 RepID=A0A941CQD2_9CLOT|nr:CDP-diacylglycerol--serine O-phosphatidyltransferase [Proteiniclasticum sediminis]MBR0576174.1 CDP-diacylglycerol--serine O-phosphatidyltransferase [Proteiniclasticum sediminis]
MKRAFIPNILTFMNLAFGIMALLATTEGQYLNAGLFILGAGLIDRYDGRIARLLNAESPLGKELDSLSDLVSFGVAPAILAYFMFDLIDFSFLGLIPVILFPVAGAYRLARYNSSSFNGVFMGVPITIAGCMLALFMLLLRNSMNLRFLIPTLMVAFSYLMVSTIKLKKR